MRLAEQMAVMAAVEQARFGGTVVAGEMIIKIPEMTQQQIQTMCE